MVVARIIGLLGGSATFAQVLLSLPMTLDLLGASRLICRRLSMLMQSYRCTIVPTPITTVYATPLFLLDCSAAIEKHPTRTARRVPLDSVALFRDCLHLDHPLLLPTPARCDRLDRPAALGQSYPGQRPSLYLRQCTPMGQPTVYACRGHQYPAGHPGRRKSRQRMGRRGRERGRNRVERSSGACCCGISVLPRIGRTHHGQSTVLETPLKTSNIMVRSSRLDRHPLCPPSCSDAQSRLSSFSPSSGSHCAGQTSSKRASCSFTWWYVKANIGFGIAELRRQYTAWLSGVESKME